MDPVRELGELRLRIERLEGMLFKVTNRDEDGRTHLQRVLDVLRNTPGEWLSASEIAQRATIDPGSARMILYTNREMFASVKISAGRVKWQISPRQRFEQLITPEPALATAEG